MFTLAHVTDWHATDPRGAGWKPLLGKRAFGWLSWKLRRGRTHRPEVLAALMRDLDGQAPDHIAVTGDLTHIALPQEFAESAQQLRNLAEPSRVALVPGNHDCYVRVSPSESWDRWAPFMVSDGASDSQAPRSGEWPTVRVRGEVALVGTCSAVATPWFQASGRLGDAQLDRLEALLFELGERDLFRVVLIHHPPLDHDRSSRRRLLDAPRLREILARAGAELVLHGHRHRTRIQALPGPRGPIPVVGARSSTDVGEEEDKLAQYHLYRIESRADTAAGRPRAVTMSVREWVPGADRFDAEGERVL
ncbi:MAG: metallophosphoesterase [Myxococcota bacterium]|nr:metallophosphoesterase [Myxococcota bacterium]